MRTVRQLLAAKPSGVFATAPDVAVIEAVRLMASKSIGAVLVVERERLVGILSERDYARKIVLAGRSSKDTPVRVIMTADVITARLDDSVRTCMQVMSAHRIRHLPVMESGQIVGVISIGDLVAAVIEDQQHELDQLQRYIAG